MTQEEEPSHHVDWSPGSYTLLQVSFQDCPTRDVAPCSQGGHLWGSLLEEGVQRDPLTQKVTIAGTALLPAAR
jgi:hypothetical protein